MLLSEFDRIWENVFKTSTDKLLLDVFIAELKKAGLIGEQFTDGRMEKFLEIWTHFRADESELHIDELKKIADILLKKKIIFENDEIRAKIKLKINMERDLIRWIIDSYDNKSIRDFLGIILNDIKLEPKHFTDIICQSLYRLIIYKFSKGCGTGIENLLDFKDKENNFGLGFISWEEFVDFMFPDAEGYIRPMNEDFDSLVDYAEKIVQMNELIKGEIDKEQIEERI